MTLLRLTPMALSRSRFALSPLAETLGSMIELSKPCADPWLAAWHARHHGPFAAAVGADPFASGLLRLVSSTKWLPDYVAVPPAGGMRTGLPAELAEVAGAPDEAVRADLEQAAAHSWKRQDLSWLSGRGWAERTASLLGWFWQDHVRPEWPRRRALLERDVTYRAGLLAAYGWPRALRQMGRRSEWVGADAIRFSDQAFPDRFIGDEGLLFVPVSVSSGTWLCERPPRYALVYPARGGSAVAGGGARPSRALGRLIGPGRAAILRELGHPATTSELAAQLGLSLGTVGGHLAVLREAGLAVGARAGRRVVYRRTAAGDMLADGREA